MSHNLINVNTIEPNRGSEISPALNDVITIASPQNGEYLAKGATDWETVSLAGQPAENIFNIADYISYNVSNYPYGQLDNYVVYKNKTTNLKSGAVSYLNASGSYVPVVNSSWWQSLYLYKSVLEGQTIIFEANIAPETTTSTKIEYQGVKGYTNTYTPLGPPVVANGQGHCDTAYGRFVYESSEASNVLVSLKIRYLSGYAELSGSVRHMAENITIRTYG